MSDYYKGAKRITKDGVPVKVAAWYSDLTTQGKSMVLSCKRLMAPYGKDMKLTRLY